MNTRPDLAARPGWHRGGPPADHRRHPQLRRPPAAGAGGTPRCVWSFLQHSPGKHWRCPVKLRRNAAVILKRTCATERAHFRSIQLHSSTPDSPGPGGHGLGGIIFPHPGHRQLGLKIGRPHGSRWSPGKHLAGRRTEREEHSAVAEPAPGSISPPPAPRPRGTCRWRPSRGRAIHPPCLPGAPAPWSGGRRPPLKPEKPCLNLGKDTLDLVNTEACTS